MKLSFSFNVWLKMVLVSKLYFLFVFYMYNFQNSTSAIFTPVLINKFIEDLHFNWPLNNINIIHGKNNESEFMIQNKLLSLTIGVFRSFIVSSFQEYTSLKRSLPYSTHINNIILCDTVNLTTLFQLIYLNKKWNSWFLITSLPTSELRPILAKVNLVYKSLVFVVQIDKEDKIMISEWYKLAPDLELIIQKIATWDSPGKFNFNKKHIWYRRKNLGGLRFVASVTHHPPMVYVNNTHKGHSIVTGLLPHLWNELGKELNFTTEYVETMTFVDEFKNVMKFNSDILLDLVVEDNRLSSVDNTVPVMKMSFLLFQRRPDLSNHWLAYVRPFSWIVWGLVGVTLIILPAVMTLVYLVYRNVEDNDEDDALEFIDAFFITFGSFVQQSCEIYPRSLAVRQIFWFSFVLGVLLYTAYSAALISNLTVPKLILPINSLQDVVNSKARILMVKDSGLYMYIKKTNVSLIKELNKKILMDKGLVDDIPKGLQYVSEKGDVLLDAEEYVLPLLGQLRCRISYPDSPVLTFPMTFGLRHNFPYRQTINYFLKRMVEIGILQQAKKLWHNFPDNHCSGMNFNSMGFEHLSSIFVFWIFGLLTACTIFVIEKIMSKVRWGIDEHKTKRVGIDKNFSLPNQSNWIVKRAEIRQLLGNESVGGNLPFVN